MASNNTLNQKTILKFFFIVVASFFLSKSVFAQTGYYRNSFVRKGSKYVGYTLSASSRLYEVRSNIKAIDHQMVPSYGLNAGMVFAKPKGAFRIQAGAYYGSESLPYSIDGMELGVSKTVYLLRLKQVRRHALEPYLITDLSAQRSSFFGSYLDSKPLSGNQSTSSEQLLSRLYCIRASLGLGLEYQFAIADTFLNFFAEVKYGSAFSYHASASEFSDTTIRNPISIDLGINFGSLIFR